MKNYPIDPEIKKYCRNIPFSPLLLILAKPALKAMYFATPVEKGVRHEKSFFETKDGRLRLDVFSPENARDDMPVLFYLHGGGFGYSASPFHKKLAALYAKKADCRVVCPDYRLLPKHPYPAAKNDCLWAYEQTVKKYPNSKIAVGGDSAGGALAIYVVNESRKRPCFQMLLYPVCDALQKTESMKEFTDTPFWNSVNNEKMWRLYSGEYTLEEVSPALTHVPKNVPDAYVEITSFDCLRDEGRQYAEKLKELGAQVELAEPKNTVHGYDIALGSRVVKEYVERRTSALRKAFSKESVS